MLPYIIEQRETGDTGKIDLNYTVRIINDKGKLYLTYYAQASDRSA